jgi:GntR family transcriptional regulator/MocR family aminotransferase
LAKRATLTAIDRVPLTPGSGATLHRQIYAALLDAIGSGQVARGARLPSTRALAGTLGVSRNSVLHAFEELRANGYIESRVGSGTWVTGKAPRPALRSALPSLNQRRQLSERLSCLISGSGYPIEQSALEDSDGNGIYLYES